jgi:hypothetical protein
MRDQLQDLAFNLVGKAMQDLSGERDKHEVIVARNHTTTPWTTVVRKSVTEGQPSIFRPSLKFTVREQATDAALQVGTAHYLVIGYVKPNLDQKYRQQEEGVTKRVVGIYVPDAGVLPWHDQDHPTCYAVTPILDFQPEQLKYYVLLEPDKGLCTPYMVAKDDVFFRHEYRDAETNLAKRRGGWSKNVAQHSRAHGSPDGSFGETREVQEGFKCWEGDRGSL